MLRRICRNLAFRTFFVAFLDIAIGDEEPSRVDIGLFGQIVPITVKNFAELCNQPKGQGYKGCGFHRVIKDFIVQTGDFVKGNGHGGRSIYGALFADENFSLKHYGAGWLSMANKGKDTNGSQFFFTLNRADWLNGKHVVFGKVIRGMSTLRKVGNIPTEPGDVPKVKIEVVDCGSEELEFTFSVPKTDAES